MPDVLTAPATDEVFRWTRTAPPEWQAELDAHFPRGGLVSWLELVWLPGTREDPVQRWGLYEAMPAAKVSTWRRDYMQTFTRDELVTPERARLVERFHHDGVLLEPFWIIQGERGGHPFRFSEAERKMLAVAGVDGEPPLPGDLPFAPYDGRTLTAVLGFDRLRKGYDTLQQAHVLERRAKEEDFRRQMVSWVGDVLHNELAPHRHRLTNDGSLPVTYGDDPVPDFAPIAEKYIATGII